MRILVDFDRVIFDSDKVIAFANGLVKKHGGDVKTWVDIRPRQKGGKGDLYSIWKHLQYYERSEKPIDDRGFLADYEKFHKSPKNVVFPGVERFLRKIQKFPDRMLLTFAEKRFQQFKIKSAGVKKYFKKIRIVPTYKAPHLSSFIASQGPTVLVDDNPKEIDGVKKLHPEIITVRVRRPRTWYAKTESKYADFEVKNLQQTYQILETINRSFVDRKEAIRELKKGQSVVYPTDTAYGLGVDALNLKAVNRLYKIKSRKKQAVSVIVSDLKMAQKYVEFSETAEKVFKKFMPGPLTIVLPLKKNAPVSIKKLSGGTGTLGLRVPDNKAALNIVRKLGRPITTPSANPRNGETPYTAAAAFAQFFGKKHQPDYYLDRGLLPRVKPSTLVMVDGNRIKVLRRGPVTKKEILKKI